MASRISRSQTGLKAVAEYHEFIDSRHDSLGIAIDAGVLAHDVLDGFDEGADRHGLSDLPIESGLKVVDGPPAPQRQNRVVYSYSDT